MNVSRVDVALPLRLGGCVKVISPMVLSDDMLVRRLLLVDHFGIRILGYISGLINKLKISLSWRTISRTVHPIFDTSLTLRLLFVALQAFSQPLSLRNILCGTLTRTLRLRQPSQPVDRRGILVDVMVLCANRAHRVFKPV